MRQILVKRFLDSLSKKLTKKLLAVRPEKVKRNGEKITKAIGKIFSLNASANI